MTNNQQPPLFTVILPLHNKGHYILETLDSLRAQTFQNWEALVIENHSTDEGPKIVGSINDPRIQLHVTEACGPCSARNYGIPFARASWILFLDSDDLLPSHFLEAKFKAIKEQPGRDLYTSPWEERNPQGKTVHHEPFGPRVSREEMLASSFVYPPFAVHTTIIRKEILTPEFYWPESLDRDLAEDVAFWFKLLHQCSIAFHDDTYAIYRTETDHCRNQLKDLPKTYKSFEKIIKINLEFLQNKKIKTTAREAYYLYTFYQTMERESTSEGLSSIIQNARKNKAKLFSQLCLWDQFKIFIKNKLIHPRLKNL